MATARWDPANDHLLGTMPDPQLAGMFGLSSQQVVYRRNKLGIAAHDRTRVSVDWTAERDALLGTMSDAALAARIGVAPCTVGVRRRSLGIAPYGGERSIAHWTADEDALLGTMTDAEVAKQTGRSVRSVSERRISRGIKAVRPTKRMPTALREKVMQLEPVLIERYRAAGLPIDKLSEWQIIEIAVNELMASARKSRIRKQYRGQEGGTT